MISAQNLLWRNCSLPLTPIHSHVTAAWGHQGNSMTLSEQHRLDKGWNFYLRRNLILRSAEVRFPQYTWTQNTKIQGLCVGMFCHVAMEHRKLAGSREELIHCSSIHSTRGEKERQRKGTHVSWELIMCWTGHHTEAAEKTRQWSMNGCYRQ